MDDKRFFAMSAKSRKTYIDNRRKANYYFAEKSKKPLSWQMRHKPYEVKKHENSES